MSKHTTVQCSEGWVTRKAHFLPKDQELQALVWLYILFHVCVILKVQLSQGFVSVANIKKELCFGCGRYGTRNKNSWLSRPRGEQRAAA